MSTIKAIALKKHSRGEMESINSAEVSESNGILGDFRGSQPGRQITILSETAWQKACTEVAAELSWLTRRANLLIDEIEFDASYPGKKVRIGNVELRVTEETAPCSRMNELHEGLTPALMPDWRGGICCDVISPGTIKIGDQVDFV